MIPWVREKFAERRARWIASRKRNDRNNSNNNNNINSNGPIVATTSNNVEEIQQFRQNFNSTITKVEQQQNIPGKKLCNEQDIKAIINVRITSPRGKTVIIQIGREQKIFDLKQQALQKLSEDSEALPLFAPDIRQIYHKYRLIRPDSLVAFNEMNTLYEASVCDNEHFLLILRRTNLDNNLSLDGPTRDEINAATRNVISSTGANYRVDINELVLQSDLQFDVRKVIISLAQESAYILGAGPYASRLISMLKQRLINKRNQQSDTLQCLVDMGFSEDKCKTALRLHNGVYSQALEWLIEHQQDENESTSTDYSPQSSVSKLNPSNNPAENIETLLEIVRIFSHRDVNPDPEVVQTLKDMGFEEKEVLNALRRTRNNQSAACEWLCGNRNSSLMELRDGLSKDSPILKAMIESPQVQMSLGNPKIFIAYISMLDNQNALTMWLGDSDTSSVISHILRKYHEEKHVLGINQFNTVR